MPNLEKDAQKLIIQPITSIGVLTNCQSHIRASSLSHHSHRQTEVSTNMARATYQHDTESFTSCPVLICDLNL